MNTRCSAKESSNQQDEQQQCNKAKTKKVKKTEVEPDSSLSSDNEYFGHAVLKHLGQVKKVTNISDFKMTVDIKINGADVRAEPDSGVDVRAEPDSGVDVRAEPDSGADINLMDEQQFKALFNGSARKPILKSSEIRLSTLQDELPVKGEFTTCTAISNKMWKIGVILIRGRINSTL